MSPTQLTLRDLRKRGFRAQVVEYWSPFANKRIDLFHCVDVLGLRDDGILGVQTTSKNNMSARRNKIYAEPAMRQWLRAGGKLELHGWYKEGRRWACKVEPIHIDYLDEAELVANHYSPAHQD